MTIDGPDPNKECKIPFKFTNNRRYPKFIQYNECALDHTGRPWCPTKLDSEGKFVTKFSGQNWMDVNKNWGYCDGDCPIPDLPAGDYQICLHSDVQSLYNRIERAHKLFNCLMQFLI